jgi:hypothetical protein
MLHEEQLNTKLPLISLTCNTPGTFTGYTSCHLMCLFPLSFVCLLMYLFTHFDFLIQDMNMQCYW